MTHYIGTTSGRDWAPRIDAKDRSRALKRALLVSTMILVPVQSFGDIGTVSAVNRDMDGTPPAAQRRALDLGNQVVQDELIQTSTVGSGQLMFLDQTTLTVAPNSDIVLDEYVYDPDKQTGEIAISLTKGALRFIGGRISKTNDAVVRTPTATVGIRGGLTIIRVGEDGQTRVIHIAGEYSIITGKGGSKTTLSRPNSAGSSDSNGQTSFEGLVDAKGLADIYAAFEGSGNGSSPALDNLGTPGGGQTGGQSTGQVDTGTFVQQQLGDLASLNSQTSGGADQDPVSTSGESPETESEQIETVEFQNTVLNAGSGSDNSDDDEPDDDIVIGDGTDNSDNAGGGDTGGGDTGGGDTGGGDTGGGDTGGGDTGGDTGGGDTGGDTGGGDTGGGDTGGGDTGGGDTGGGDTGGGDTGGGDTGGGDTGGGDTGGGDTGGGDTGGGDTGGGDTGGGDTGGGDTGGGDTGGGDTGGGDTGGGDTGGGDTGGGDTGGGDTGGGDTGGDNNPPLDQTDLAGGFASEPTGVIGFDMVERGSLVGTSGSEVITIPVPESPGDLIDTFADGSSITFRAQELAPGETGFFEFVLPGPDEDAAASSTSLGPLEGRGFSNVALDFHFAVVQGAPDADGSTNIGAVVFGKSVAEPGHAGRGCRTTADRERFRDAGDRAEPR